MKLLHPLPSRVLIIILIVLSVGCIPQSARAAIVDLTGWVWSSNVGWFSVNSTNSGAGAGASYSVKMDNGTNPAPLSGYAWSPNIGWLSFNAADVAGCSPAPCAPTVNTVTGDVTGWARVLSGVGRSDGWDGWVQLSGDKHQTGNTNGTGGVTYIPSTKQFKGYAWGDLVGWMGFDLLGGTSGSSNLSGTCTPSVTSLPSTGGTSRVTVSNIVNGTGSYSYEWSTGGTTFLNSVSTNPYTLTYSANADNVVDTYTPFVRITDSTSKQSNPISCGTINVAAKVCAGDCGPVIGGEPELVLIVRSNYYPDVSSETQGGIARVRADKPFTILAEGTVPAGTQCTASKDISTGGTGWEGAGEVGSYISGETVQQQSRRVVYNLRCEVVIEGLPTTLQASIPVIAVDPNSQQF